MNPEVDINVPGLPALTKAIERLDGLADGLLRAAWWHGFEVGFLVALGIVLFCWWFRRKEGSK